MKNLVNFKKTYECLDDSCRFVIDKEISTSEHSTEEMPLTRKTIEFKDLQIEDGNENRVSGWISTRELDWSGDIMIPEGVILDVYQKNPTVLMNHDTTKIIGKCVNLQVEEYGIKATMEFAPTDEAQDIKKLAKGGFLNCFSVGFIPVDFVKSTERTFKAEEAIIKSKYPEYQGGAKRIIKRFVLLEYSLVTTPDNPNAIITAKQIQDMEIKSTTLELLNLKCDDCEEASNTFKEAIVKTLEYNADNNELTLHKFINREIKVIAKPISQEVLNTLDDMGRQYNEDMLELKKNILEDKKNLLIELQERKNKQLEQKRLEAILTQKGKLVRY